MESDNRPGPRHVAVIMDGNGRWAQARGHPRTVGHRQGAEAVKGVVRTAGEFGVSYLTLFAFSAENWKRSAREVQDLMGLLRTFVQRELDDLRDNGVCLRVIGDRTPLPEDLQDMLARAEAQTRANRRIAVTLALNYGGRQDIVNAAQQMAQGVADGELGVDEISLQAFGDALSTSSLPDPDLLVRTGGEQRISNFLLWQCAYAEMFFIDKLWPDIGPDDVHAMVETYQHRRRRFGAIIGS
ncbi:polyprenyl diphosphate synthase [Rhodovibrio sodomensis]|uniref:polyprenyl diphosphate synthase n=1 Tax=Rhodovibrio sodomensis TaxID=1088 RepID=UPI00237C0E61|nr:polyprenyl diphosphate synthase [Rhodovibrio sodomensis]